MVGAAGVAPAGPAALVWLGSLLRSIGSRLLRLPQGLAWLPSLVWMLLITALSSVRGQQREGSVLVAFVANLGHAPLFGLLALWLCLLLERPGGWPDLCARNFAGLLLVIFFLGGLDELHQGLITGGRDMSALDLATDLVGAAAVLSVIRSLGRLAFGRELAWRLPIGLAACLACAAAATFPPPWRLAPPGS